MSLPVIIIGAGGHARVVADALLAAGVQVLGLTDADATRHGHLVCGLTVLGGDGALNQYRQCEVMLANGIGSVGSTAARRSVQQRLSEQGWRFTGVHHPGALASRFAQVSPDVQLMARSVLQPGAKVGDGCIVNTGAVVEHDVELGEWVHVAPGAIVCGDAVIGARSHVGAGAVVRQGVRLGADTVVGAGAVVIRDFAPGATLIGVPARAVGARQ